MRKEMTKMATKGNPKLYFARMRPDVILPSKNIEDGGLDIYANFSETYVMIPPHTIAEIPTGLISAFPKEYVIVLKERHSTGTKGMDQRAGVMDSGFRGEWNISIGNDTNQYIFISKISQHRELYDFLAKQARGTEKSTYALNEDIMRAVLTQNCIIYPYTKAIVQALFLPNIFPSIMDIQMEDIIEMGSKRGTGCCGSSNK